MKKTNICYRLKYIIKGIFTTISSCKFYLIKTDLSFLKRIGTLLKIVLKFLKKHYLKFVIIAILAFLAFIDSLNFRAYYLEYSSFDNLLQNHQVYYINIELWVMLFASIFAVLGTYFFTRLENTKSFNAQRKLSSNQLLNSLTLLSSTEYLLKETIRTYNVLNLTIPPYLAFPVNKKEFPYLDLIKEINIVNNTLLEHNINFSFTSDTVLYRPFNDNDIIFQATVNLEPLQKITYVNPDFFENLHMLSLFELIGFNTRTATIQYINENKDSILSRLDSLQRMYKPDYEETLQNNIEASTIHHVILMVENEINNLLMNANQNYLNFISHPELSSNHKPLVDSIKELSNLYFIKYSKYLNFIEHDQFENISLLSSDSKFFSSKNNCLLIVYTADMQTYFDIKNNNFNK